MTPQQVEELEQAARKNALMPSAVVLKMAEALRQMAFEVDNYRKLVDYYREAEGDGNADGVRAIDA